MKRLYEEDSYLRKFESEIIDIDIENKLINLKETAFYGKSGGQPGDTGNIIIKANNIKIKITETFKKNGSIFHQLNTIEGIKIGDEIKGIINWEKRYRYMKMHTALHLLCGVIPLAVTGGQIGEEKSRLDFNADKNLINKEEIQVKLNKILKDNHEVSYHWINYDELMKKTELIRTMSVKPPITDGKVRLVKIGNIDLQACGGTHVKKTSEIGHIDIAKIENKGKMNRRINININD